MKQRITSLLLVLVVSFAAKSQMMHTAYLEYIQSYSPIAMEQQKLHNIPASIKLAQGLLESAAGKSRLSQMSNNHFGIKCHDWTGQSVRFDDDAKQECFRKYPTVRDSYEDHSLFLTTRSRYVSLFKLEPTDYRGWAFGLKAAGYATDPNYAQKLIKLIEDYDLHKFDMGLPMDIKKADSPHNRKTYVWGNAAFFQLKGHQLYKNNGVICVFSEAGDSYASIANEFGLKEAKLLKFNDLKESRELEPGTVIYIKPKKKTASSEYSTHRVAAGENMYRIAQKYGMTLQSLYDLNKMPYSEGAGNGMVLKLQKDKK